MLTDFEKTNIPTNLHQAANQAIAFLNRVGVENGFSIRIEFGCEDSAFIIASKTTPDVRTGDPGKMVTVRKGQQFSMLDMSTAVDMEAFLSSLIRMTLADVALHEVDEWFTVDGKQVNPPHKDKGVNFTIQEGSVPFPAANTSPTEQGLIGMYADVPDWV